MEGESQENPKPKMDKNIIYQNSEVFSLFIFLT